MFAPGYQGIERISALGHCPYHKSFMQVGRQVLHAMHGQINHPAAESSFDLPGEQALIPDLRQLWQRRCRLQIASGRDNLLFDL
jgi:hypothetical protein